MKIIKIIALIISTLLSINKVQSQINEKKLLNAYQEFGGSTREITYVHINKSTFIKNELLGFNAYLLDKSKKKSLSITNNLYCTILDENNKIVKSKLVKVENGFANNTFKIDSLFTSGVYKFRAYTNWMLNFNERNYYEHPFLVLDSKTNNKLTTNKQENKYSIQVLPESGHLVSGVQNNLGIVVKNKKGIGLSNLKGKIINSDNNIIITEFKLNQFGIGKVPFIPSINKNYKVVIEKENLEISAKINNIEDTGIAFSVSSFKNKVRFLFKTNNETKQLIKNKNFYLAIHNGSELKTSTINFNNKNEVLKVIDQKNLFTGMNIFTVFDADKKTPILERLFFNYNGISKAKIRSTKTSLKQDSVIVKLDLNKLIDINKAQNISVSVLPRKTKSYNFSSNILSQLYLEPYVKGFIQNASYYFSNETAKVKYDLDNLLITQGWSSYDWKNIFKKPSYPNKFEQGINVVANIKGKVKEGFLVYPLKNNKTQIYNPTKEDKAFVQTNLFPEDNEAFRVSLLKKRSVTRKPNLYIKFYPSKIPELSIKSYDTHFKSAIVIDENQNYQIPINNEGDSEELNEIEIKTNLNATRIQKIKDRSFGQIEFFDDRDTRGGRTLASYLSGRGFEANDYTGTLTIINTTPNTPNNNIPLVILDNIQLLDFGFLANFKMNTVDYIEINKSGVGYGLRGGGGVIKIVTDPEKRMKFNTISKNEIANYIFPITFNSSKKYYTPIYQDFNTRFFKEYGAISWLPNLKINDKGIITFKILNTNTNSINLFIEGVFNDNVFISETKSIYPLD